MPAPAASRTPNRAPTLSSIQHEVIAFLAAGVSIRKICETVDIHRNTIGNWRRTVPAFAQALADAQYDRVLYWRDCAEEHAALAIETIGDIMADPTVPASVRLRAALAMLKHATTLPPPEPAGTAGSLAAGPPPQQQCAPAPTPIKVHNPAQQPTPTAHPKPHKLPNVAQMPKPSAAAPNPAPPPKRK